MGVGWSEHVNTVAGGLGTKGLRGGAGCLEIGRGSCRKYSG